MMHDDPLPPDLANLLSELPEEIAPVSDLWGSIEHNLRPKSETEAEPVLEDAPSNLMIPIGIVLALLMALGAGMAATQALKSSTQNPTTAWESEIRASTQVLANEADPATQEAIASEVDAFITTVQHHLD